MIATPAAAPGTDEVSVWLLRTDQPADVVRRLLAVLDESELARATTMIEPVERDAFVVAHGAARLILAGLLGLAPERIRWQIGPHGKPELAFPAMPPATQLQCNLSHSAELAAFAVSRGRRVGVDVQRRQFGADLDRMAARYYPADEAGFVASARSDIQRAVRFTGLWSRKEACVKAGGGRLIPGLHWSARAAGAGSGFVLVSDPDGPYSPYLVRDLIAPAGYHAAVALSGPTPFRVLRHCWTPAQPNVADSMVVERC